MTLLLVGLGGAVGAVLRFVAASALDRGLPLGTLGVNVAGSFLLGALSAAALPAELVALAGAGLAGGLTTYSAFAVQTHRLGPGRGAAYAALTVALSLAACALGYAAGT